MRRRTWLGPLAALVLVACSDPAARPNGDGGIQNDAGDPFQSGAELRVTVPETGRVGITLAPASVVTPNADDATGWDLAFEGFDVFTNSGPSGRGKAGAFGPLDPIVFLGDVAPEVPFMLSDRTGGAFLDWYDYDGTTHALWNRFHVYGVKDGTRLWKVQILSYYDEREGAPVAALYRIRYAEVTPSGVGPTQEIGGLDGTAGGTAAPAHVPSECLDLATGQRTMLTPEAARGSRDWHLCFRRTTISVNGDLGGPRGVGAVDLDAASTATEPLEQVKARTPEGELARFESVTHATFDGRVFRGDGVVTPFGDAWLDREQVPIAPAQAAWLVTAADGATRYLVAFAAFESPTDQGPGTVVVRFKPVR